VLLLVLLGRGLLLWWLLDSVGLRCLAHHLSLHRHLALEAHHLRLLLFHGASGVKGIRRGLRSWCVGIEAVLRGWTPPRSSGEAAGAALDAARQGRCRVGGRSLAALAGDLLVLRVDSRSIRSTWMGIWMVCVHGRYGRVALLGNEEAMLGHACRPLKHVHAGMLLRLLLVGLEGSLVLGMAMILVRATGRQTVPVVILRLHVEGVHVLAKVGKGSSAVDVVRVVVVTHHGHVLRWPLHGVSLWGCRGLVAARIRHGVIALRRVDAALMGASLVLYHGCLPAKAVPGETHIAVSARSERRVKKVAGKKPHLFKHPS